MKLLSVLTVFALCGYCVGVPATETGGTPYTRLKFIAWMLCNFIVTGCHVLQVGLQTATPIIFSLQAAHRLCKKALLPSLAMYG